VERLLVDLSEADDVTTAGMNVLLDVRQQLISRQGVIALVLPPHLRRRFELLQLDRRFLLASSGRQAADLLGITVARDPAEDATNQARAA
jgi:anti-anti-sigma regulatory factor